MKCLQSKLSLVAKSVFECQGVLTDNVRTGEQQSVCSDKLQRAIPNALSKQKFLSYLFLASLFNCADPGEGGGVVSLVYRLEFEVDFPGFEARMGARNFSHLQNLQIGCEASQAPIQWILVISLWCS